MTPYRVFLLSVTVSLIVAAALLATAHHRWLTQPAPMAERADQALQPDRERRQAIRTNRERIYLHVPKLTRLDLPLRRPPAPVPRVTPVFARDTQFIGSAP